jgi:hypothetical protein
MINSIDDLKKYSLVVMLYSTGASGEFIASALVQSIPAFAKTREQWISENRKTFADALGKTLNGGWHDINRTDVVQRFNSYLEQSIAEPDSKHLILAHPDPASLEFIQSYLNHVPTIEIVTNNPVSIKFRNISRNKVSYLDYVTGGDNKNNNTLTLEQYKSFQNDLTLNPKLIDYRAQQHLSVEWQHLMITDTAKTFNEICEFLNCQGSIKTFRLMVEEYLDRNQDILNQIQI